VSTAAEQKRFNALREIGCIACWSEGKPGLPGHIHHIVDKGYRKHSGGHASTLCLCEWHHVGQPSMGFSKNWMAEKYGPSLAENKKAFIVRYGTERELLEKTNGLLK
jgi:hypothetical protein